MGKGVEERGKMEVVEKRKTERFCTFLKGRRIRGGKRKRGERVEYIYNYMVYIYNLFI